MKHLLYVPFTGLGLKSGYRGDNWLKNRINVFKNFTLTSILHQSNRNFTVWISWRPEEEGNKLVMELENSLKNLRDFKFIMTYGGVCFEDDKYDRPKSLERLKKNLEITLPKLEEVLENEEIVLMTIQPSDDMYLSDTVQKIQDEAGKFENKPMSIGYKEGYIMNYNTLELAEYARTDWKTDETSTYQTNTIPPFFTVVFPRTIFLDAQAHMKWTGPYRSHEYIAEHTDYHELKGPGYIVGTHGENISTTWTHRYKGKLVENKSVLLKVGLYDPKPLKLEKNKIRTMENKVLNKLPKWLKRKYIRLVSPGIGEAINDYNYFIL